MPRSLRPFPKAPAMLGSLAAIIFLSGALPAQPGEFVLGLGFTSYSGAIANDGANLDLEVHSDPVWQWAGADWSFGVATQVHADRQFWIGAGVSARWAFGGDWFVEASVMPGYYEPGNSGNDLGGPFEIRTLGGIGRRLNDRVSVSLAFSHTSNANTGRRNPGANTLSLRTRWAF